MPAHDLFQLGSALRTVECAQSVDDLAEAVDPVSAPLGRWLREQSAEPPVVAAALSAIVGVLLTIWILSEEPATPERLDDVIDKALAGRLNEMPIPRRGACFCGSGKKYKSCHGRG
ncbi:SEC-C domain-containing protein [Mycolicibacterium lacusdiani]|uniref:SEC-C domain-containing protein n=1 Tax=Mycolicibacterium lacusdiani TaxID=2895283 RepID=UPI001F3FC5D1|nr:SEC-C domain-containing protein [Mycolicibacterium lacusdiani]